ncbi:MAG: hypothetical protein JWM41_464 [Gemmatimonadetes bacterium]|nr:hypothetical protein [Gemmatimonadota bacterium]
MDGALVYAAVPEWKRADGGWELRRLTMNEFRNGVLTRRTVATFDVSHEQARLGLTAGKAEATLAAARLIHRIQVVASDVLLPRMLEAQVGVDTLKDGSPSVFGWIVKGAAGLGGIAASAGSLIGDAALAALGGVIGAFGIGFDLGVFVSQQFPAGPSGGDQACIDYLDSVQGDPQADDPVMDAACGG